MTGVNRHRIHRQTLELDVDGLDPTAAQSGVTRALQAASYLSALEGVLDRIASADQFVPLERLELDLGAVSIADLPRVLLAKLENAVAAHPDTSSTVRPAPVSSLEEGEGQHAVPATETPPTQTLEAHEVARDGAGRALLTYLVSGRLPWWFEPSGKAWFEEALRALPARSLRPLVTASERVRLRLRFRLDNAALSALYAKLTGVVGADVVVRSIVSTRAGVANIQALCWDTLLLHLEPGTPERGVKLMRRISSALNAAAPRSPPRPPDEAVQQAPMIVSADRVAAWPEPWRAWARASDQSPGTPATREADPRDDDIRPTTESGKDVAPAADTAVIDKYMNDLVNAEAESGIRVRGIGCLLFHPFLDELFRTCGWWDGSEWTSVDAQTGAMAALAYLVFGDTDVTEPDLVLQKQLVGIPWESPIDMPPLEGQARVKCNALLDAVRQHWDVVKSASDNWLREQFYARDGELFAVDDGYRCRVESCAQDVLLGKLPWGYGVIRLPWMEQVIFVEWG